MDSFEVIDVRKLTVNFLPMIVNKASKVVEGDGICVVQSFEPIPLYSALSDLGFQHLKEQISDKEYRVYFYRISKVEASTPSGMYVPLKPTAIVNFKTIFIIIGIYTTAKAEEETLIEQFGKEYIQYREQVPMFLPKINKEETL